MADDLGSALVMPPPEPVPQASKRVPAPTMPGLGEALMRSTVLPPQPPAGTPQLPQAELRASPPAPPSERITDGLQSILSAAGADTYNARSMAQKLMGLVQV